MAYGSYAIHFLTCWCLVVVTSVRSVDPSAFDPGCSFVGGQCLYTVKLGHTGQCDKTRAAVPSSTDGTDGSCCNTLSSQYTALKSELDNLKVEVQTVYSFLSASNQNVTQMKDELAKALAARSDIVAVLSRKEAELNTTKTDLANVVSKAASEIQNLRQTLAQTQNSLSSCQTALGVGSKPGDTTASQGNADYHVTYVNFNNDNTGFTFTKASYGSSLLGLMHKGSSTSTGPRVEHSWGINQGRYLGLDASQLATKRSSPGTTTMGAESGTFPPANAYCVKFWTYMEGADVGILTMNIKINGGTGYPVYQASGPKGSHQWQLATVELDSEYTANQFQIDFVMTSSAYYTYSSGYHVYKHQYGDIAVDDVYVYNTTCSSIPKHPAGAYSNSVSNVTSFYTFHPTPLTWTDAYDTCRQAGPWSALVSIETDEEQAFLVNTIKHDVALSAIGQNGFYTSGTDADKEHHFTWTNTGVPQDVGTGHWHIGQPNNVAGNQNCLLMEYPTSDYQWGDVACDTKHPFICETVVEISGGQP